MYPLKLSTALTVLIFAHDSNGDPVTGKIDANWTKRISKASGAFAAMTVTITELENGWYSLPISASHSDTLGILSMTFNASGVKQINVQYRVHTSLTDDLAAFVDTEIATILAAVDTEIGAIKVKTDFLPSVVAGGAGGIFIAGTNAATAITTALTANLTGNVTGNVSGSVGSVTADVGITQVGADKVWGSTIRTLSAFSTALAVSVWDVLAAAVATASSIGLQLKTNNDATTSSRSTVTTGQVRTEVVGALNVDTYAEPVAVPAATATITGKLGWLMALSRNKLLQTATTQTLRNDTDAGSISTATLSDDGTTLTRAEWT